MNSSLIHATQQVRSQQACAEGAVDFARGFGLGLLSSTHCSSFKTALYAAESFCAVLASLVKSLRRNVRKASAAGSGFEVLSMQRILVAAH